MLSWNDAETIARAYICRNLYRLRPDMTVDDAVQEAYFSYRRCCDEVTAESLAERTGRGVDDIPAKELETVQAAYFRQGLRNWFRASRRSFARKCAASPLRNGEEELIAGDYYDHEEVEVSSVFDRLSPEAKRVFVSDGNWDFYGGTRNSSSGRGELACSRRIATILGQPHQLAMGRRIWQEIRTAFGIV